MVGKTRRWLASELIHELVVIDKKIRTAKQELTELVAATPKVVARKLWMSDHLQLRGSVMVDDGAAAKIHGGGKSLLPIGVVAVEGDFHRGDVIAVRRTSGEEIGRGLCNYSSTEARLIARKPSSEFERLLGFIGEPELIHRDNFVLS